MSTEPGAGDAVEWNRENFPPLLCPALVFVTAPTPASHVTYMFIYYLFSSPQCEPMRAETLFLSRVPHLEQACTWQALSNVWVPRPIEARGLELEGTLRVISLMLHFLHDSLMTSWALALLAHVK